MMGQIQILACDEILNQSIDLLFWGGQKNNICFARNNEAFETCVQNLAWLTMHDPDPALECLAGSPCYWATMFSLISSAFQSQSLLHLWHTQRSILQCVPGTVAAVLQNGCWVLPLSSVTARCPLPSDQDKSFCSTHLNRSESSAGFFAVRNSRWCQTLLLTGFPSLAWMFRSLHLENLHQFCHSDNTFFEYWIYLIQRFPLGGQQQSNLHGWRLRKFEY